MFTVDTKLDEIDGRLHHSIGEWLALTWRNDLFLPPKGIPYGTHLASYVYCDPGDEIRCINACWMIESSAGVFRRTCKPLEGINTLWRFIYSTLKKFTFQPLTLLQLDSLAMPDIIDMVEKRSQPLSPSLQKFRRMAHLDKFRHPGFPDSVAVVCGQDVAIDDELTRSGEGLWVSIRDMLDDDTFLGILYNQPNFYKANKGDEIIVRHIVIGQESVLVGTNFKKTS